jgi:membrane dipeptidase
MDDIKPKAKPVILVDGHEDLAWNIKTYRRDYSLPVSETRRREEGTRAPEENGDTLLGWPEYRRGRVAVVFATLFASPERRSESSLDTQVYSNAEEANHLYRGQLETYFNLVDRHPGKFRLIGTQRDLQETLASWEKDDLWKVEADAETEEATAQPEGGGKPVDPEEAALRQEEGPAVGLVPLMEGAEGVRDPGELDEWWEMGLRVIGPAWAGTRFCGGTHEPGPMTNEGFALLEAMADLGFILDISHMDEEAALQALDRYPGTIIASHSNAAALLKGADTNRHISNKVIERLIERDATVGIVPYNRFLVPGWRKRDSRQLVSLQQVVAQIDYICQIAGDARHTAIGSDYDGGFGVQMVPAEIDTIADLQKLIPLLREKGYAENDIAAIFSGNLLERLQRTLPEGS